MQAKETKILDIIEGTKQYVVPLFQRSFSWEKKEWDTLWNDVKDLCEMDIPRVHFFGSIVSMPATSVPEGVSKFLLIDGQQRLTTVFILLSILKDVAEERKQIRLSEEIKNTLLTNHYKEGRDYYKFMPTQVDREAFTSVIENAESKVDNQIVLAWKHLKKKVKSSGIDIEKIKKIITQNFSVVSITLDVDDNPYLVFEGLNAKGRSLSQADLIKNYFFMRIHVEQQEAIYAKLWQPMQSNLGEDLSEFIRHFLMRTGGNIKQSDVYYELKDKVSTENAIDYLTSLNEYSIYYRNIKYPEYIDDQDIRIRFERLVKIEVTTAYPLLLFLYGEYVHCAITKAEFCEIIDIIENYLIRRFVCDYKTNALNRTFSLVYGYWVKNSHLGIVKAIKSYLSEKQYPKDVEFREKFMNTKLYGGGDRIQKTKYILELLEASYKHKETVITDTSTIEHIMPQTLSEWWVDYLGEEASDIHEIYLNTIGNLTLTAYNSDLSNKSYPQKRNLYSESHFELNRYFSNIPEWKKSDIIRRAEVLTKKALEIWPCFGTQGGSNEKETKAYTIPQRVYCIGKYSEVKNWRDVISFTLDTIYDDMPEAFSAIVKSYPKWFSMDDSILRKARRLKSGYYIEVNDSADTIYNKCSKILDVANLGQEDWKVDYK